MRLGVVSDTHGDVGAWKKIAKLLASVERIIHAGDILYHGPFNPILPTYNPAALRDMLNDFSTPIIFAKGNCDSEVDSLAIDAPIQSPYAFVSEDGVSIIAHHGHQSNEYELLKLAKRCEANIVIVGHTHIPKLEEREGVVLLNPGSPSLPKGNKIPTVAIIDNQSIRIIDVDRGEVVTEKKFRI